ncbi:Leucine-zipper-like transcriptional regulator 1 [Borealophlyctis nickersoniae]|nr:Leucine-zipper-like transcriptional regulator 1 [Borealophlyctis nickersoniae]
MVLCKLSLQICALAAAAVATAAADISFTSSRQNHNMHATANRIIVLGGHNVVNDPKMILGPDSARGQNIIATTVSAMDYGTGRTADFPVSPFPFDTAYNPLNSFGAACDYDARTKYIQCFGGQLTDGTFTRHPEKVFNILSTFDTTTMKWIRAVQYREVSGRAGAKGAVVGSSFYVYGGDDGKSLALADLLRIDLTTYALTSVNASGISPGGRTSHCMAALSNTQFIMHGGRQVNDSMGYVNQVHIYDTQSNTWTEVKPDNSTSSPPTPSPRLGTGCTVLNGSFYTFGGSDTTRRNDLNIPNPRYYTRLVTLGKYLVTYGGTNAVIPTTTTEIANDTRLYFYNTQTEGWVSSGDVLSDPWFKSLSASDANAAIPGGQGSDNRGDEGGVNVGAVAGGVVAGVVLIVAAVGGIMFVRKRNARYLGGGKAAGGPLPLQDIPVPEVIDVNNWGTLEKPEYHV